MGWGAVRFHARLTAFRHLAVFPEQAANWAWLDDRLSQRGNDLKLLNLFGYTGVASLVAAARGAQVTHVDASKKAIGWARENAGAVAAWPRRRCAGSARTRANGCSARFAAARATTRSSSIRRNTVAVQAARSGGCMRTCPALIAGCAALLSPEASFLLLNAYSERLIRAWLWPVCWRGPRRPGRAWSTGANWR